MRLRPSKLAFVMLIGMVLGLADPAAGQTPGARVALVIGEGQYRSGSLATALNDAGLVAQTLQTVGFDVTGAANLDARGLRQAFGDFLTKVQAAGPDAIVFVYVSGQGVQYAGENYLVPIEATIARDSAVPQEAVRVAELTTPLAALAAKARIVVLDAAHRNQFASTGTPLAGGLVLTDPAAGALYAFNAAPGTVAPDEPGPYGIYALSLTGMLRQGGVTIDDVFAQTRLRVNEQTRGALLPWDESQIDQPIVLLPRAPGASVAISSGDFRTRPIRSLSPSEAYAIVIQRDTLAGYLDFLAAFPNDPLAGRVRVILAARREALTWQRTLRANRPNAYWTYMQRYARGPHVADARRRLAILSAALEPPPRFDVYDYDDLPPPPPDEYAYVDRRYVSFDEFDYPPPPPPPVGFLPPDDDFRQEPPPPPAQPGFLPLPVPIAIPGQSTFGGARGNIVQPNFGQQAPSGGAPAARPTGQPAPAIAAPQAVAPQPLPQTLPQPGRPGGPPLPNAPPAVPVVPQTLPRPGQNGPLPVPNEATREREERRREAPAATPVGRTPQPALQQEPARRGALARPEPRVAPRAAPRIERPTPRLEPKAVPRVSPRVEPRAPVRTPAPPPMRAPAPAVRVPPPAMRAPPAAVPHRPAAPPAMRAPAPAAPPRPAAPPPPAARAPAAPSAAAARPARPPGARPEAEPH